MSGSPIPDIRERLAFQQFRASNLSATVNRTTSLNGVNNNNNSDATSTIMPSVALTVLPTTSHTPPMSMANDFYPGSNVALNMSMVGPGLPGTSFPAPADDINSFYFYETEQITVLWILFAMIVLGNSAVLVTLALNKSRKSRMNFFIKHLAIADLTVGLINVLTDIVWRVTVAWYAGNAACKCIRFLQATVTYASTYVLVALSIDRYDAITHPMNFSGSWRRARILVLIAWSLSVLFSLPMIFLFEERMVEGQVQCWIDLKPWQWKIYMTLIAMILFVIPAFIISACYTIIVRTIWTKSRLLLVPPATIGLVQPHTRINGADDRILRHPHHHHEDLHDCRRASSRGIIPRAKIKTVKMTFVIVFVFVICWSPFIVFDLLQVYDYIPRTQTNIAIATFIQSLAPLNSAANPVIYCLFSTHMCRTLRKLPPFKWLSCCLTSLDPAGASTHCLGYMRGDRGSRDSTRTATTSLTTLSTTRRSGSAASLRQHTIRLQAAATAQGTRGSTSLAAALNRQHKVAISVV